MSIQPQVVVGDLHPFYAYNIGVCAVTSDVGPCAYFNRIQLPEDGKLHVAVHMFFELSFYFQFLLALHKTSLPRLQALLVCCLYGTLPHWISRTES